MLTGRTRNKVEWFEPPVSSSSKSSSTTAPRSSTAAATTSATPSKTASSDSGSKPNTAGIAAGVVVGVVGLAAIIGGVWFFLRRRRQRQAEEDYRRNAAGVNDFINGGKTSASSMNDSRIDPSFMDRRQSNGSIADNEDYSRRILKVCRGANGFAKQSVRTNAPLGYQCMSAMTMAPGKPRPIIFKPPECLSFHNRIGASFDEHLNTLNHLANPPTTFSYVSSRICGARLRLMTRVRKQSCV
jgi:hypothetical protein